MLLSNILKEQIKSHALKEKPNEVCGLITISGDCIGSYPCRNISYDKLNHFEINPYDYLRISENNKIIGVYHSQSSNSPSELDVINKIGHNIYSLIYSIDHDEFIEVTEEHLTYGKYLNKEFLINKQDCFALIQQFYKNEYNILIGNYERDDNWFKKNPYIIKENFGREGFIEVDKEDMILGDIVVFKSGHFGIYLKKEQFLHHERNKLSTIEQLTDSWKSLISNVYRHKDKKWLN